MFSRLLGWLRQRADRDLPQHLRAGRRGEDTAYDHLKNQGYRVVARNFRSRKGRGEIDLVAWDGDELVFVEVKTRKNEDFGTPLEAVGADKRGHLVRTALEYARRAGVAPDRLRFDVVGVVVEPEQRVELWKNVFSAANPRGTWRRL
jgi:putative endonuclease